MSTAFASALVRQFVCWPPFVAESNENADTLRAPGGRITRQRWGGSATHGTDIRHLVSGATTTTTGLTIQAAEDPN
jgi:hypothetical protein